MIGVVIFGHGRLGHELARAAETILGEQPGLLPVGVEPDEGEADILKRLNGAVDEASSGDGVLLLTDMFGGTPMNFGSRYIDTSGIEVVTGVNLAMLIKALTGRKTDASLAEIAKDSAEHGRKDISVAGDLLRGPAAKEQENKSS